MVKSKGGSKEEGSTKNSAGRAVSQAWSKKVKNESGVIREKSGFPLKGVVKAKTGKKN